MLTTTRAAYSALTDRADSLAQATTLARLAHLGAIRDGADATTLAATGAHLEAMREARDAARHAAALEAADRGTRADVRHVRVVLRSTATGQRRAEVSGPGLVPVSVALDYSAADPYAAAVAEVFPGAEVAGRLTATADRYARRTPRAEVFRLEFPPVSA